MLTDADRLRMIKEVVDEIDPSIGEDAVQSNMEDGWGGNSDDAFSGGECEGKAWLAETIKSILKAD